MFSFLRQPPKKNLRTEKPQQNFSTLKEQAGMVMARAGVLVETF